MDKPFFINKKHVLVTRAKNQASALVELCLEGGLVPVLCPMIEIRSVDPVRLVQESSRNIVSVFTSKNAVRPEILELCADTEIAVIGTETAKEIQKLGYKVDLISTNTDEKSLGADILDRYSNANSEIVLYQGNTSSSYLLDLLNNEGFVVGKHITYEVCPSTYLEADLENFIRSSLKNPGSYFISLLSAYTAEIFLSEIKRILSNEVVSEVFQKTNFVVIGNKAKKVLEREGVMKVLLVEEKSLMGVIKRVVRE